MPFQSRAIALLLTLLCAGLCAAQPHRKRRASRPRPIALQSVAHLDAVFTATRQINSLCLSPSGDLWAATAGGVLHAGKSGKWHKWTRADGLPSHEILSIEWRSASVIARTPRGDAFLRDSTWHDIEAVSNTPAAPVEATWRGLRYTATESGLEAREGSGPARTIALPDSRGTHITALLSRPDTLLAGLYGDGIWKFDGSSWRKMPGLPDAARDVTALAGAAGNTLWLGTRRDGVWKYNGALWLPLQNRDEPFDHNAQSMASYGGALWISTLEDGLIARTARGWRHFDMPQISTSAPRQLVSFGGALYARHGGGQVDRFDGKRWTRDVFASVPRHKTLCIAQGGGKLYLGQWGGWSEWDGKTWAHFFAVPELSGVPLMAILPANSAVWVGTQSKGLLRCVYSTALGNTPTISTTVLDERQGLPDEWITCLARQGTTLFAGTFVGGLAYFSTRIEAGGAVAPIGHALAALQGENVTALEPDGTGGLWIATRTGLWHERAGKVAKVHVPGLDSEIQSLCLWGHNLWVGTRTGLFRLAQK